MGRERNLLLVAQRSLRDDCDHIAVAVDPDVSSSEEADEIGTVVIDRDERRSASVLADPWAATRRSNGLEP